MGIDAPESVAPGKPVECYAREASQKLKQLAEGRSIRIEYEYGKAKTDRYGRSLGYLFLPNGSMINALMIEAGAARFYGKYKFRFKNQFSEIELIARRERRGLWAVCESN